jgi:hypothetical protein
MTGADVIKTDQTAGYFLYEVDDVSSSPFGSYNKGADDTSDSGTIYGARPTVLFRLRPTFPKNKKKQRRRQSINERRCLLKIVSI